MTVDSVFDLKAALRENKLCLGSWITLGHPAIAEIMCRAGFNWLAIDLEHSVITIRETEELIRVIELSGVCPLVRLSSNDPVQIKRVMDAGSQGVIVPMVNSKADALRAVDAVYYPPHGRRGVGLARAQRYGADFSGYQDRLRTKVCIIAQIEHIEAVEKINDILSVDEIDGYIIGPYDLSASMGIAGKFSEPEFTKAIDRIRQAAKAHQKPGGIHVVEPDLNQLSAQIESGARLIPYSFDTRMIDQSCRQAISFIKGYI